jgi:hypothetical protein
LITEEQNGTNTLIKLRLQTSEKSERLDNKRKEERGKTKIEVEGYCHTGCLNGWNKLENLRQKEEII